MPFLSLLWTTPYILQKTCYINIEEIITTLSCLRMRKMSTQLSPPNLLGRIPRFKSIIWVYKGLGCSSRSTSHLYRNCFINQIRSVSQSCPTLCDPMNRSTPGLPVHHQLPEFIQTHVHRVGDAIQPSHPLSSPSPPAPNPSQHLSPFQWVNSSHEVAKVLEFQL